MIERQKMTESNLRRRYRAERRYRFYGKAAIACAVCFLVFFFAAIVSRALPAFSQYEVLLRVDLPDSLLKNLLTAKGEKEKEEEGAVSNLVSEGEARRMLDAALAAELGDATGARERRARRALLTPLAALYLTRTLKQLALEQRGLGQRGLGQHKLEQRNTSPSSSVSSLSLSLSFALSSSSERFLRAQRGSGDEEAAAALSVAQRDALAALDAKGLVAKRFNLAFFTHSDSRVASAAGIHGALLGSLWALLIAFLLAFPLGLLTAVHLEEFAPRHRLSALIEVAIYNLAAVPSIVFGLLGLVVFLNWWQLPRSAPLTGGMVLALMTLPTIVVTARSALKAVPEGIRNAGLALGASHTQTVLHHVLPQAMPGILTGAIIGMARALGETAPLLMIGMVAFIAQAPATPLDPATALPVQIFLWADHPDPAFSARAAAAILVMLVFLVAMNATAVLLRQTFERKRQQ